MKDYIITLSNGQESWEVSFCGDEIAFYNYKRGIADSKITIVSIKEI